MHQFKEERFPIVFENEGQKIFAVFHRPISHHKVPAVLVCHGLGGNKAGRYRLYVVLASLLAKEGIATLRFDFRGAGDSEGEFSSTTVDGQISDALKAFQLLYGDNAIDSNRIGLFGRSFGGAIGIMAAQKFNHIKSIVLWAPLFNGDDWHDKWQLIQDGSLSHARQQEELRVEGQQGSLEFFEQFFKIHLDSSVKKFEALPFLHIQGEKDNVINIKQADFFADSRKNARGMTKFIRLPDADHHFSVIEDQHVALDATVDWFKKTL